MGIRVLVADDDHLLRLGVSTAIGTQPDIEIVAEAENGIVAVARARELSPDVVLMDIRMPEMDGVEATRRIVSSGLSSKVLVMTTFDDDEYLQAALLAGARGFLLKNAHPSELINGIRAVANGDAVLAPRVTRRLIGAIVAPVPRSTRDGATDVRFRELTDRERDVLLEVAAGRGNAEIAQRLRVAEGTIKTHVGRILTKLGLRDRVQLVVYAYENHLIAPGGSAGSLPSDEHPSDGIRPKA